MLEDKTRPGFKHFGCVAKKEKCLDMPMRNAQTS